MYKDTGQRRESARGHAIGHSARSCRSFLPPKAHRAALDVHSPSGFVQYVVFQKSPVQGKQAFKCAEEDLQTRGQSPLCGGAGAAVNLRTVSSAHSRASLGQQISGCSPEEPREGAVP
ncbi:hypothetical protein GN956_G21593 [Arapaima gigas]